MSKLKVGTYVRTKEWGIQKIAWFDNEDPIMECGFTVFQKSGYKTSDNIIDLIEVGDYVNGFPVIHKENDILKCGLLVQFKENEIKSIVTKEQFESISYKVGE